MSSPLEVPVSIRKGTEELLSSQPCSRTWVLSWKTLISSLASQEPCFTYTLVAFLHHPSFSFFPPPFPLSGISLLSENNPAKLLLFLSIPCS